MTALLFNSDTIVALATPEGNGALGVVRISGLDSILIAKRILKNPSRMSDPTPQMAQIHYLIDADGETIDQAVVLPFISPNSFTGENSVEFTCHGGREVIRLVIRRLIELGCRYAEPGEFTKRAFVNGKMTLDQAEAISSLINSKTSAAAKISMRILSGNLKNSIQELYGQLFDLLATTELDLDFSDEEISIISPEQILTSVDELNEKINTLLKQYKAGRLLKNGANVVIAGPPNVGKSSLLNILSDTNRAIISDIPGTTRDYLDVVLDWNGLPVRLVDTAGLRDSSDEIERIGTNRSRKIIEDADLLLWLLSPPNYELPDNNLVGVAANLLYVHNKSDLKIAPSSLSDFNPVSISCKTGSGIGALKDLITSKLIGEVELSEVLIIESRHESCLLECRSALNRVRELIYSDAIETDLIAHELHIASDRLGEIIGKTTPEDLLNHIFSGFCIGK
jgi:tRNA modification GTPase